MFRWCSNNEIQIAQETNYSNGHRISINHKIKYQTVKMQLQYNRPSKCSGIETISSVLSTKEENGNALQCSCLGYSMDRGAWQATVPGVTRVRQDWVTKPPHNLPVNLWSRKEVEFRLHMAHLKWSNIKDQYGSRHFYLKVI